MAGEGIGSTSRVAVATIAKWAKKTSDQAVQKIPLVKFMQENGRIKKGAHGGQLNWVFQYRYHDLEQHVDVQVVSFQRQPLRKQVNLPWRGYDVLDAITIKERAEHGGKEAMVEIFNNRKDDMARGALQKLAAEMYIDGNASGNEQRFHGFESFMSLTGQTATDEFATTLNDTYAGLSTSYTSLNSSATKGTDEEYGAWSPKIVNCNRTVSGSTQSWEDFADEYLRAGILEAQYGDSMEQAPNLILLSQTAWKDLVNLLDDKERLTFARGAGDGSSYFGFPPGRFLHFDGVAVTWDFYLPTTDGNSDTVYGYGANTSQLELHLLDWDVAGWKQKGQIFKTKVDYDPRQGAELIRMTALGNLCFKSPRHFLKFAAIS